MRGINKLRINQLKINQSKINQLKLNSNKLFLQALLFSVALLGACSLDVSVNGKEGAASEPPEQPGVPPEYNPQERFPDSIIFDADGDGIVNAYDFAHLDSNVQVSGRGTLDNPFIIRNIYQLQAIAGVDHTGVVLDLSKFTDSTWLYGNSRIGQLSKAYTLDNNIDAAPTRDWNHYRVHGVSEGFYPIGNCGRDNICNSFDDLPFSGSFIASSFSINNLYVLHSFLNGVGLFGMVAEDAVVASLRLIGFEVSGNNKVGGLAGFNQGTLGDIYAYGTVNGRSDAGGLVGVNRKDIINSYVGGITNGVDVTGGMVGRNQGKVEHSSSAAIVHGGDSAGGMIGVNDATGLIDYSFALGKILATSVVGGLVGSNNGKTLNSYASGNVYADEEVGGLAGNNQGSVVSSYASGHVTGERSIGGLVGMGQGLIDYSYAHGSVTGNKKVGGLVGFQNAHSGISSSYSTGAVTGASFVGGLVGYSLADASFSSYWDVQSSGQTQSFGGSAVQGVTTAQLKNCGINGIRVNDNLAVDCSDLFPVDLWDSRVNSDGSSTLWDFSSSQHYPLLTVGGKKPGRIRFSGGSNLLPNEICFDIDNIRGTCVNNIYVLDAIEGLEVGRILVANNKNAYSKFTYTFAAAEAATDTDTATATDTEADDSANNINASITELFAIDSDSGVITMVRNATVDDIAVYQMSIIARPQNQIPGREVERRQLVVEFTAELTNGAPFFDKEDYSFSDLPGYFITPLVMVSAVDPEGGDILYTVDSPAAALFQISDTGIITPRSNLAAGKYTIEVTATDEAGVFTSKIALLYIAYEDTDRDLVADHYDAFPNDASKFSNGTGTAEDPFIISNIYQLQAISGFDHTYKPISDANSLTGGSWLYGTSRLEQLNNHYQLANNINATITHTWSPHVADGTEVSPENTLSGFIPIGNCITNKSFSCDVGDTQFSGSFDGRGNSINNLHINSTQGERIALFGSLASNGSITSVGLQNVDIYGGNNVAALVGENYGSITASYATGRVELFSNGGMLAGYNRGDIYASYATGNLHGSFDVGGLAGYHEFGNITSSYAAVNIIGGSASGGFVGQALHGFIYASYSTSIINSEEGGSAFAHSRLLTLIYSSYWDNRTSGVDIDIEDDLIEDKNYSPTSITTQRLQGCGRNGIPTRDYSGADCLGVFPEIAWGDATNSRGMTIGWIFEPFNHYPKLRVVDKLGNSLMPSPVEQFCHRQGLFLGCSNN